MRKVLVSEVLSPDEYLKVRNEIRKRIFDLKNRRRISVGEKVSLMFENYDTVLYQIQEMVRVENITDRDKLGFEVETYNQLLPERDELSATLYIEIRERGKIREELDGFIGIDRGESVYFDVAGVRIPGIFEEGRSTGEKISSVHYVRFRFDAETKIVFLDRNVPVKLVIDHGFYRAEAPVKGDAREALIEDILSFKANSS